MLQNYSLSKIGFHCPLWGTGTNNGYSYAAVELIKAWQALGIPVWANDTDAPVIFNMGQPHFYERVDGKLNIGYTAWESTEISKSWVQNMNLMDEIWAPSQFNVDVYRKAGVTVPLRVLPHGINPDHWSPKKRTNSGTFNFLHIGGDEWRKGALIVLDAFVNTFGEDDDVHLTLKTGKRGLMGVKERAWIKSAPKVSIIEDYISQEELRQMYYDHDAMIYPSRGEGFGLIPFQAMATGMPTAATNWGGMKEFVGLAGYPIGVEYLSHCSYAPHLGQWAEPSYEDVQKWMIAFYDRKESFRKLAYSFSEYLVEDYSWESIAKSALEYMTESLNTLGK